MFPWNSLHRVELVCFMLAAFILSYIPRTVDAAVFNVPAGDVPALIQAIIDANGNIEDDVINLGGGTYNLTGYHNMIAGHNGLPVITTNITINGNGSTITGPFTAEYIDMLLGNETPFRIFFVDSYGELTLDNVTVTGGWANDDGGYCPKDCGGGILNHGKTTLQNGTVVTDNRAEGYGGGVANAYYSQYPEPIEMLLNGSSHGTLYVDNSQVYKNNAYRGGGGIANLLIYVDFNPHAAKSVSTDLATRNMVMMSSPPFTHIFNNSLIDYNHADFGGGLLNTTLYQVEIIWEPWDWVGSDYPSVLVENSTFLENEAYYGGGLLNEYNGYVHIDLSLFKENFAYFAGGGIYNSGNGDPISGCYGDCAVWARLGAETTEPKGLSEKSIAQREYVIGDQYARVYLTNSDIERNFAFLLGGGVLNSGYAYFDIADSNFFFNGAEFGGGLANLGFFDSFGIFVCQGILDCVSLGARGIGLNGSGTIMYVLESNVFENESGFGGGLLNAGTGAFTDVHLSLFDANNAFVGGGLLNFGFESIEALDFLFDIDGLGTSQRLLEEDSPIEPGPGATLFVTESTVTNNKVVIAGGGIYNGYSDETNVCQCAQASTRCYCAPDLEKDELALLLVNRSTISNNSTGEDLLFLDIVAAVAARGPFGPILGDLFFLFEGTFGGGVFTETQAYLLQSTITGNKAHYGGGVALFDDIIDFPTPAGFDVAARVINADALRIRNCTITDNILDLDEFIFPGLAARGNGVAGTGIHCMNGEVDIRNTIVGNQRGGADDCGGINSNGCSLTTGYNISSDDTCDFTVMGDKEDTDPKIGPLLPHGGPTKTHALIGGSPAIDMGSPGGCFDGLGNLFDTDQRSAGFPRPINEVCDIGAYEFDFDHGPNLTCPLLDITLNTMGDSTQAFWPNSVLDFEQGVLNFNCNPTSGSTFPIGTTKVTCTVSDSGGNTTMCMFNVTVNAGEEMNEPLLIVDPPEISVVEGSTNNMLFLTVFNPGGESTEDGLVLKFELPPGFIPESFVADPDEAQCTLMGNLLECVLAPILPGGQIDVKLNFTAPPDEGLSETLLEVFGPAPDNELLAQLPVDMIVTGGVGGGDAPGDGDGGAVFGSGAGAGCAIAPVGVAAAAPLFPLALLLALFRIAVRRRGIGS